MIYCKRCLYPANHPLGIIFDQQGVCSGCRIHEEKDVIDWGKKEKKLEVILDGFRNKSGKSYDCIVPVSGARDSYFIVHTLKNVFKMHPLLVTYNKHYNTETGIRNLAYLKTLFGCDLLTLTVSPNTVKKITKKTLQEMGSIYWHCLAGQTVFPVQVAVRFKIPLIVWGAHQGCDQVGMFSHHDEVEMTRKYRKDHDLMGYEAEDLADDYLTMRDLSPYVYPHDKEIEKVGIRGIHLNNYVRWDSKSQHEDMIKKYGYKTLEQQRTFDTYNDVDCFNYSTVHDYTKYLKWGYGKVTDHATREIRLKRMTRTEGIDFVKKYQHLTPDTKALNIFLEWLGINEKEFYNYFENKRDGSIWQNDKGKWQIKDSVINHQNDVGVKEASLEKKDICEFVINQSNLKLQNNYVLIGRGWDS